uniref:Gustatory receptor n=1 Tax=Anopheles maculatus TaxID=74869 RepID=A0A182TCN8_9DIPT
MTAGTVASQFALFFYYPNVLYQPTVPIFIVILYYIVNVLQALTTGNMMIGQQRRRLNYEGYFAEHIATIPYVIAHTVPFIVSYLILTQYYCVYIHLASIMRKLNERLVPLMSIRLPLESDMLRQKPNVYNILGQPLASLRVENNHLDQIEHLRLLHVRALEIASNLGGKFGFVIILIVVAAFASVNIELLELYQCVKLGNLGPLFIVLKFLFAGIKFSFYILIAYPNRLIQQEVVAAITSIMVVLIQFSDTGL